MPPDLIDVMRSWTQRAIEWAGELEQVVPYANYIDREPQAARRWRAAVNNLVEKLEKGASQVELSPKRIEEVIR
jgi:hypothetical protein